jgi:Protein of unknown function (DUF4230)
MPATTDPVAPRRHRSRFVTLRYTLLLGLILGAVALAVFVHHATSGIWNTIATSVTGRSLSYDVSQPTVVSRIQRLERLETVTYSMDKIVEGDRTSSILPDFLVGDKLMLLVHGQAIAGVDLSQLKPSDVTVNGKSVTVHLPPAQIFVTALDDSKTRVFSRDTGWFVQADPNLESQVREKAQQELNSSALAAGILQTAHNNAVATISRLLLGFGFTQVHVD